MYDELVRELRENAEWAENSPDFVVPTILLYEMRKAADVIEELSKRVASEIALEECWHRLENRPLPDIPKPPKEKA